MKEIELLQLIGMAFQNILRNKLVGIYVHGSIAFQCFRWDQSDIDFLVVMNDKPTLEEKKAMIAFLLGIEENCPPKGLEMSVVLEQVCNEFEYPNPFELHFSNAHKDQFRLDLHEYCSTMHGVDQDLAAHFTVIKEVGIKICGKDIATVFRPVPRADYFHSINQDIADAIHDIVENPVYVILNLCRVLAFLQDDLILSKQQGGIWGMEHLPSQYHVVLMKAMNCYCDNEEFVADRDTEQAFAEYMLGQINSNNKI